ncbi:MAG: isopeptide-forming domain-containing fimbrial protein [Clostridiales bacterium]|nr:isopeptide-forming domain-containing fimbrial protein [Clostridiales bacterium]
MFLTGRDSFTGTFYATITNSDVQVINSLGNGSNGSHFIITNSDVNFSNNTSHGLSTGILTVTDSNITANNNGLTGIIFNNRATFKNANVSITGTRGTSYWNAGMRALSSNASCTIADDCIFRITDNYVTGIFLDANTSLNIAEGADVLVVRNEAMQKNCSSSKELAQSGGGIVVRSGATATLSSTTQIYNNHAALAGDDIYLESTTSGITFQPVHSGWRLDGTYLDGDTHCKHDIDGWYNDGYTDGVSSARWEADAADENDNYISLYDITGQSSASGILALKAAHGTNPTTSSDPDENGKTSLPGLEKSIVTSQNEDGVATATTSNATAAASDKVTFELVSIVPETLKNYIEYIGSGDSQDVTVTGQPIAGAEYTLTFHDTLDSEFTLDEDSIIVRIGDTVLDTSHYNVSQNEDNSFTVTLHLLELYTNGIISEEDFGLTSITVTYDATLSADVTAGTYYNKAYVTFEEGKSTEDTVEVDTYGLSIFKYDQSKASASNATDANAAANLQGARFTLSSDYDGTDVIRNDLVSGADGYIILNGLDAGTYYLTETEAPDGFVCSSTPIEITISEGTSTDNVVYVVVANAPIPSTGGAGTRMYLICGACLIAAAGTVFVVSRKKKD